MKVYVKCVVTDKKMGFWEVQPKACPARAHLDALGQKPWTCLAGLTTNIQGPVPIGGCKHRKGDMEEDAKGEPLVTCSFQKGAPDA